MVKHFIQGRNNEALMGVEPSTLLSWSEGLSSILYNYSAFTFVCNFYAQSFLDWKI